MCLTDTVVFAIFGEPICTQVKPLLELLSTLGLTGWGHQSCWYSLPADVYQPGRCYGKWWWGFALSCTLTALTLRRHGVGTKPYSHKQGGEVLPCKQQKTSCAAEIGHLRREHLLYFNVFWWKRHLSKWFQLIPSMKLTVRPWKQWSPTGNLIFQPSIFRGRPLVFREGRYFFSIHHPWRKRGKSESSLNLKVESSRSGAKLVSRSHGEAGFVCFVNFFPGWKSTNGPVFYRKTTTTKSRGVTRNLPRLGGWNNENWWSFINL